MIRVEGLKKLYGRERGLHAMNLQVSPGELVGLVGPNGAGKTTLMKVLATLVRPDEGRVDVRGMDVRFQKMAVRGLVGYMPDVPGVYQDMKVREYLLFFADAFHLPGGRKKAAVEAAMAWSGLADRSETEVEHLSLGWKQRLSLAKTLLHNPTLLLLDEPATGLDPLARLELRRQLKELNQRGVTILVSSHILSDLEDICSRIVYIADGRDVGQTELYNANAAGAPPAAPVFEIEFLPGPQPVHLLSGLEGVTISAEADTVLRVTVPGKSRIAAVVTTLVSHGVQVVRVQPVSEVETKYQNLFGGRA